MLPVRLLAVGVGYTVRFSIMSQDSDPRLTGAYVREVSTTAGVVTLLGVVHDHPASSYRVRRHIGRIAPDILALELPPSAVPLFSEYATDSRTPPVFGGEMSAAIQAGDTATVVGIDRPTGSFLGRLFQNVVRTRPSRPIAWRVLKNTVAAIQHALVCRVAAVVAARTSVRVEVDTPTEHPTDWTDTPAAQAGDEQTQIRRSRTFMNAFQTSSSSRASRLEDATREDHMAEQLTRLSGDGRVVAVVGIDHLDPLERLLTPPESVSAATNA